MKIFLLFIFLSCSFICTAQQLACNESRYRDTIFSEFNITEGIKYGEAETFAGANQELFVDVYEPSNDSAEKRATIVVAFGGSFLEGGREDVGFLCEAYAKMGYVAVAIDYRLYDGPLFPIPMGETMQNVVIRAVQDMKAVVRFLKEDAATANEYRIDPEYIYLGGISAGSIVACHAAMLDYEEVEDPVIKGIIDDLGGIEGSSNDIVDYDSNVRGLLNFSGGLSNANYVDETDVPFFSVHDEKDPIVPFGSGSATIVFGGLFIPIVEMDGSLELKKKADEVGLENELITIDGSEGHVSYFLNQNTGAQIVFQSAVFVQDLTCRNPLNLDDKILDKLTLYPNPTTGLLNIDNGNVHTINFQIFDQMGKLMKTGETQNVIDLSKLNNGLYLINIQDQSSGLVRSEQISLIK